MGLYQQIRELWKKPKKNLGQAYKDYLIQWRKEPVTIRLLKPTRIDRARSLGYKAKQGYIIVRQRIMKSAKRRERNTMAGRRPKHARLKMVLDKNSKQVAEERANKKYKNCEILGSYELARDGKHVWYEIILVDTQHPAIKADKRINWISKHAQTGRTYRGLTAAGRKSRGLLSKGKGAEKVRPSKRANLKRRNKI